MVAIFSHHDVGEQSRRGQTAIQQAFGQGGDQGRIIRVGLMNIFSAHDPATEKTARLIIQLFADFLADATPLFGLRFHRFGINHFLHHRQVLGQTGGPLLA
jgi:hypothetical protein